MRYLIVNADDFAITKGVSEGITEAARFGVVSSTSMLANTEHFDHAVSLLEKNYKLNVGAHLTLTNGTPVSKGLKTILNSKGEFFKQPEFKLRENEMDKSEIEHELSSQIEKLLAAGLPLTHISTHQHIHKLRVIKGVVISLAKRYSLAVRRVDNLPPDVKTTEEFTDKFVNESATDVNFKMILRKYEKADSLEIMCHPGHCDVELINKSAYAKKREFELSVLSKYELMQYSQNKGIKLVGFDAL